MNLFVINIFKTTYEVFIKDNGSALPFLQTHKNCENYVKTVIVNLCYSYGRDFGPLSDRQENYKLKKKVEYFINSLVFGNRFK